MYLLAAPASPVEGQGHEGASAAEVPLTLPTSQRPLELPLAADIDVRQWCFGKDVVDLASRVRLLTDPGLGASRVQKSSWLDNSVSCLFVILLSYVSRY